MVWLIAAALLAIAGLNAPLALCTLSLAVAAELIAVRAPQSWLGTPWCIALAAGLLIAQVIADLYFVPISVRDHRYLHPRRTHNNYLHARVQSLYRPLTGALVAAALPLPLADWSSALIGFSVALGGYWLSAWIREYIALMRGAIVLVTVEALKHVVLIPIAALTFWLPPLALLLLVALLVPVVAWSVRLQGEYARTIYGGQSVSEDARVVRSD
ncbi:hypothetical protein [Kallotenue papyrolyticum]|uniref:hypothetical protein n=1 Tax=Kallotenue papyrolyticum TaxID=1325125 RepID=UPI0004786367|nr:hypothetical protein [Kallotenue papyrolyticum]